MIVQLVILFILKVFMYLREKNPMNRIELTQIPAFFPTTGTVTGVVIAGVGSATGFGDFKAGGKKKERVLIYLFQ